MDIHFDVGNGFTNKIVTQVYRTSPRLIIHKVFAQVAVLYMIEMKIQIF